MSESTTVYVVTSGEYSDYGIHAIFSTRALADAYIKRALAAPATYHSEFNVEEWYVDRESAARAHYVWTAGVLIADGSVPERGGHDEFAIPKSSAEVIKAVPVYDGNGIARARSHKSAEHALKLATEARQKHLREHS